MEADFFYSPLRYFAIRYPLRPFRTLKKAKGSGTPADATSNFRTKRVRLAPRSEGGLRRPSACGAHSPAGIPPRLLPGRPNTPAQLQLRASWGGTSEGRALPALPAAIQFSGLPAGRSSCRPGVGPEPPGSGVTVRPREPLPLRSPASPGERPVTSGTAEYVTVSGTNVNRSETNFRDWSGYNRQSSSWPDLFRPSTSSCAVKGQDVDARHKLARGPAKAGPEWPGMTALVFSSHYY